MSADTTPRDYLVTVRLQRIGHPPSAEDRVERVEVTAYAIGEAIYQAALLLDARSGGLVDFGLRPVLLYAEPRTEAAFLRALTLGRRRRSCGR